MIYALYATFRYNIKYWDHILTLSKTKNSVMLHLVTCFYEIYQGEYQPKDDQDNFFEKAFRHIADNIIYVKDPLPRMPHSIQPPYPTPALGDFSQVSWFEDLVKHRIPVEIRDLMVTKYVETDLSLAFPFPVGYRVKERFLTFEEYLYASTIEAPKPLIYVYSDNALEDIPEQFVI